MNAAEGNGLSGWLAGPAGAFVSRCIIGLIALIGTILGWVVTNGIAAVSVNITTLTTEVRMLSDQIGNLKISVALTAEQTHQLDARLAQQQGSITALEAATRIQEGRLGSIEGRMSSFMQRSK